jgi:hypothetical protein
MAIAASSANMEKGKEDDKKKKLTKVIIYKTIDRRL